MQAEVDRLQRAAAAAPTTTVSVQAAQHSVALDFAAGPTSRPPAPPPGPGCGPPPPPPPPGAPRAPVRRPLRSFWRPL
jgi:hypothetical protein